MLVATRRQYVKASNYCGCSKLTQLLSQMLITTQLPIFSCVYKTHAEKLNAEQSKMRNAVIEISKHLFFSATSLKNIRFAHRYYAARMLTLSDAPIRGATDIKY